MKRFQIILPVLSVVAALLSWWMLRSDGNPSAASLSGTGDTVQKDTAVTITLSAVGDLMCHAPQFTNVKVTEDSFAFHLCFDEIRPILSAADFTIGNLETTLAAGLKPFSGYPRFNSPDDYFHAVQGAGFDFIITANNHSLDTEGPGLLRTLDVLDENKMPHTGTYRSQRDRDSIRVADVKGIRIAILNYSYGTNGLPIPSGMPWCINLIDTALIRKDIQAAKADTTVDAVMVTYHFGAEYLREPDASQKAAVNHAMRCGADIIIGAHPHVIQPVEFFKTTGGLLDTGFVAWSLGNFISNQGDRYRDAGLIVHLALTKNLLTDKVRITDAAYTPTWVYRGTSPSRKAHTIYPASVCEKDSLPAWFTSTDSIKVRQAWEDTKAHVPKYTKKIRLAPEGIRQR